MKKLMSFVVACSMMVMSTSRIYAQVTPTTYGTLDNFDVVNDTGIETHGFEIELEGISVQDVPYFFGAPYERYGDPEIVSNSASTGVIVRYKAMYDPNTSSWSAGTPVASSFPPTDGHSCWSMGDPNYPNVGCDHFGISLNATPTQTTYRWLIENPGIPGTLMVYGTNVPLPAPVWNVTPPANPAVDQPIAAAVITPIPSDNPDKCGEAMWMKVYTTELPNGLHEDDLNHLVVDDPDVDIVPEPAEVEFEWILLQACPGNSGEQEFGGGLEVGAGAEAVSRRFEFFKYSGAYDPDPEAINEAMCDNPIEPQQQTPDRCGDPNSDGIAGVGSYIGKQNVAINLAGEFAPANLPPVASDNNITTNEDSPVTFNVTDDDTDADGVINVATVDLDSTTPNIQTTLPATEGTWSVDANGNVTLSPSANYFGIASTYYSVQDNDSHVSNNALLTVTVNPVNDAPIANDQSITTDEDVSINITLTASDIEFDTLSYQVESGPAHGTIEGVEPFLTYTPDPNYNGPDSFTFIANDGVVDSNVATISLTVNSINDAPIANAGPAQSVKFHDQVTLDGSGSTDVDTGDILTYLWVLTQSPAHSKATLVGNTTINPIFVADKEGTYEITLTVYDGNVNSTESTVLITAVKAKKK